MVGHYTPNYTALLGEESWAGPLDSPAALVLNTSRITWRTRDGEKPRDAAR